jgi:hypothetical protein
MWALLALVIAIGPFTLQQRDRAASNNPVTLSVALFDYASVPSEWLSWAKEEMARIYREIGVEIVWQGFHTADTGRVDPNAPQPALIVLIRRGSASANIPDGVVGFSSGSADERRRVAYVLYDRMNQFRLEQSPLVYRGKLLGHLMAHEVGHLLLPVQSHSPKGLMRAQWSRAELQLALEGRLRFTDEQARLIRSKVSGLTLTDAGRTTEP